MINHQEILTQVYRGDIPDNWRVIHSARFSIGRVIKTWVFSVLIYSSFMMLMGLLVGFSSQFLREYWFWLFIGIFYSFLAVWLQGDALLVIVPDGMIHVADNLYLASHFSFLTPEGKRGQAEYRYKYPNKSPVFRRYKILSFAEIAGMQLKVRYLRGIWLELHYHTGERKNWLIDKDLNSVAAESAQSIIVAYTQYVAERSQLIGRE